MQLYFMTFPIQRKPVPGTSETTVTRNEPPVSNFPFYEEKSLTHNFQSHPIPIHYPLRPTHTNPTPDPAHPNVMNFVITPSP